MRPRRIAVITMLSFLVFVLTFTSGCSASLDKFYRVRDRQRINFDQMISDMGEVNIIFVGEQHGNGDHQRTAIKIIEALRRSGRRVALGVEMFTAESQPALHEWIAGRIQEGEFADVFQKNWNFPWHKYSDTFLYAREKRVPVIGLNVPRNITQKVANKGFDSLTEEERKALPPGLTCNVDEEYMEFIRKVHRTHGKEGKSFVYFCEAQMVWDSAMAYYIMDFLKRRPDTTVVVLAGSVHSWKRGIPEQVRRQSDYSYMVILPESTAALAEEMTVKDADFILLSTLF